MTQIIANAAIVILNASLAVMDRYVNLKSQWIKKYRPYILILIIKSEYECKKCNNFNLTINGTSRCVEKCPISHYSDSTDPENKICLPCYKDCYGCTGPKDYITAGGCTKCHSALVNNDQSYTILKCIEKETYDCTNNEFSVLVPSYMQTHPLKGKNVCRKCNNECEECFDNGVKLNTQCKKCKNFYSNSTGECVRNCSNHKEYLDEEKKV